jgi:hypothetical protein
MDQLESTAASQYINSTQIRLADSAHGSNSTQAKSAWIKLNSNRQIFRVYGRKKKREGGKERDVNNTRSPSLALVIGSAAN